MNAAQFEALAELLRMRGGASQEAARLVLVEGIAPAEAARRTGIKPQAVNNVLNSCQRGIDLLERAMTTTVKRGAVDAMILTALQDGEINEAELASIITAHRSHIAARHAEVSAILALHSTRQEPRP